MNPDETRVHDLGPKSSIEFVLLMAATMSLVALCIDVMLPAFPWIAADLDVAAANDVQLVVGTRLHRGARGLGDRQLQRVRRGHPELRDAIVDVIRASGEVDQEPAPFRMWVDRSFTVSGAGQVVTGTVTSGSAPSNAGGASITEVASGSCSGEGTRAVTGRASSPDSRARLKTTGTNSATTQAELMIADRTATTGISSAKSRSKRYDASSSSR